MPEIHQTILPSGRAVRFRSLDTDDMLAAQQRVAAKIGKRQDPGNGLFNTMLPKEIVASGVLFITGPRERVYKKVVLPPSFDRIGGEDIETPGETVDQLDVDAMLGAIPAADWQATNYQTLMGDGDLSIKKALRLYADFERVATLIADPHGHTRRGRVDTEGKVQTIGT